MNFYYYFFIVILYFWPSAAVREVYIRLNKTSAGATEESKKKLNGETGFPIINGFVQVASKTKIWAHWLRRLLKSMRKWCIAHPPEVKLGKCFVNYFNIKIPGLRRHDKNIRYNEGSKITEYPQETLKKFQFRCKADADCRNRKRISRKTSIEFHLFFLAQHIFSTVMNHFRQYRDFLFSDDFKMCLWDYFWKRFWIWVDSTPDFPLQN